MISDDSEFICVQTTSDDVLVLQRISRLLVEKRLAACAQISGPVTSHYRWEGEWQTAQEWLCAIKTTRQAWPRVEQAVLSLHNYQVPELMALPLVAGHSAYLQWLRDNVSASSD
jgi:periplasmic divalent cation tolerance protein